MRVRARYTPQQLELLEDFKQRLTALASDPTVSGTATPYWMTRAKMQTQLAKRYPIEDFLRWTNDYDHEQTVLQDFHYRQLAADAQWESRWKRLTRIEPWGNPHEMSLDAGTAPVPVQHVHTLMEFERASGDRLLDGVDVIVELGAGYGNFARMLRRDGFTGPHVIIDLPHTREFQRTFLTLCGETVSLSLPSSGLAAGVSLLLEADIPDVIQRVRAKRVLFIAMWSLSEVPLLLRAKLFPALHASCVKYLIQTQWPYHCTDPHISNEEYFTEFMKASGRTFHVKVPGLPEGFVWDARNLFAPVAADPYVTVDQFYEAS